MNSFGFLLAVVVAFAIGVETFVSFEQKVSRPLIQMKLGKMKGSILKSQRGADIYAFRGIRYAQAPIGELRFAAPVEMPTWKGILDATQDGMPCPQSADYKLMSEDCLFLNVYSRNLTGNSTVMVYIHGGGNKYGSSHSELDAGPQYLMDHDIVLVSMNYRLGALGFMSTATEHASGNFGYLDQVLALKWVQQHIDHFGGNPNSVTIFGLSAGGMAVTLLMASPLAIGLFHRAIAMSGSATSHYDIDNVAWTQTLARSVSCPMYNAKDVVECLRNVTWEKIIDVCSTWEPYGFANMKWNYQIDNKFLFEHPSIYFQQGKFSRVPLLTGITKDEFTFSVYHQENNTGLLNDISLNFDKYAPELFQYNDNQTRKSDRIYEYYLGTSKINATNLKKFGEIFADGLIKHGVHRLVHLARPFVTVYYYRMDHASRRSSSQGQDGKPRGVSHADDLQYLLTSSRFGTEFPLDDPEMLMVDRLTKWWTTFAQTGSPDASNEWRPTNNVNVSTMYIADEVQIGGEPNMDNMNLWDSLFPIVGMKSGTRSLLTQTLWPMVAIVAIFTAGFL